MAAGESELRQRLAFVIANDQVVLLERPLAAGEEIARTAAFGRDGALRGAGGIAECHEAGAARGSREPPASGQIDRRRRGWWRRRRWRNRGRRRFGSRRGGAGAKRREQQQCRGGFRPT